VKWDASPLGFNIRFATPEPMVGGTRWATVAGTWATFCGLSAAGETWCWGHGADGELGVGIHHSSVPVRIGGL
jgi:hypothetical protein